MISLADHDCGLAGNRNRRRPSVFLRGLRAATRSVKPVLVASSDAARATSLTYITRAVINYARFLSRAAFIAARSRVSDCKQENELVRE